jgi:predicted dehydrogenase
MEAFMYRFHPRTERAAELAEQRLENVHTVTSEFAFSMGDRTDDIRLDPDLAGGSVMDVGCYAISAARLFLGEPEQVYATTVDRRDSGVDTEMAGVLEYDDGSIARVASGFDTPVTQYYRVEADNGWLEVDPAFDVSPETETTIEYEIDGEHGTETFDPIDQYRLEVDHFAEAVESGSTPRIDRGETQGNMAVIDAVYESSERGRPVTLQ